MRLENTKQIHSGSSLMFGDENDEFHSFSLAAFVSGRMSRSNKIEVAVNPLRAVPCPASGRCMDFHLFDLQTIVLIL